MNYKALEQWLPPIEAVGAEVNLEEIRRIMPTKRESDNVNMEKMHRLEHMTNEDYLTIFFHRNPEILQKAKCLLKHLIKSRGEVINVMELAPVKLKDDPEAMNHCIGKNMKRSDLQANTYPNALLKSSEAFVSAGFLIDEIHAVIENFPVDALQLSNAAMLDGAEKKKHVLPLDQTIHRFLISKLFAPYHRANEVRLQKRA